MATENKPDEQSFVARFSNGFLALIGAVTPADFSAKFTEAWQALTGDVKALKDAKPVAYDDKAILGRLDALETAQKVFPTEAQVKDWAKAAGSLGASEAVAAVGQTPGAVAAAAPAPTITANTSEKLVADGKYVEAWKADAKLQEQFVKAEHYEQYMKAAVAGRVYAKSTV